MRMGKSMGKSMGVKSIIERIDNVGYWGTGVAVH